MQLLQEFFEQGDMCKRRGMPLPPLCDRQFTDIPMSQINFSKYLVKPTFDLLSSEFIIIIILINLFHFCYLHIHFRVNAIIGRSFSAKNSGHYSPREQCRTGFVQRIEEKRIELWASFAHASPWWTNARFARLPNRLQKEQHSTVDAQRQLPASFGAARRIRRNVELLHDRKPAEMGTLSS